MAKIGFARVSTQGQSLVEQEKTLKDFGCKKIFAGKHSGKAEDNQKALDELFNYIREGDVVVVTKIDRLGRSIAQCLTALEYFRENNIAFVAIEQGINTQKDDLSSKIATYVFSMFAEMERSFIVERTKGGKQAKIDAGNLSAIGGRPRKIDKEMEKALINDIKSGMQATQIAKKYKISRPTFYKYKKRLL